MEKYAFIDVSNTLGTTRQVLNFGINWGKLLLYLKGKKWNCKKVFYYQGSSSGKKHKKRLEVLEKKGYTVRTKLTHIHRDRVKEYPVKCDNCKQEFIAKIIVPGLRKSNCDVELTVDALENAAEGRIFLFFTGDGDFSYLIETLINKGVFVILVSSYGKDKNGDKPFSTRLKDIIIREEQRKVRGEIKRVSFLDINDLKQRISEPIIEKGAAPQSVTTPES